MLARIRKSLADNISFYAHAKRVNPELNIPPSIKQDLIDLQALVLRHIESEEVSNYFLAQLRTPSAAPDHRDALRLALAYGRDRSLHIRTPGNGGGQGQGQSGSKKGEQSGKNGKPKE